MSEKELNAKNALMRRAAEDGFLRELGFTDVSIGEVENDLRLLGVDPVDLEKRGLEFVTEVKKEISK